VTCFFFTNIYIYIIIKDDSIDSNGEYITVPFKVYGVLKVEGENYDESTVCYRYVSDKAWTSLVGLIEDARRNFFNIN